MSRGAWVFVVAAGGVVAALFVGPILAGLAAIFASVPDSPEAYGYDGGSVALRTICWASGCGALAVVVGWVPGRLIAARPGGWMTVFALVPLALPASLFFDAWWLEAGPQSFIGRWAAQSGSVSLVREVALGASLVGWSWPITAFIVASMSGGTRENILPRLDGLSIRRRLLVFVRREAWTILTAWLLTAAVVAGNTVSFDLAQVASWGFELKTLDARGASAATVLRAGLPAMALTAVVVSVVGIALHRRSHRRGDAHAASPRVAWFIPLVFSFVPLGFLIVRAVKSIDIDHLLTIHGEAIANTLTLGLLCAVAGGILAVGSCTMAVMGRWPKRAGIATAVLFGIWAVAPASLVAIAWEAAWNRPGFERLYDSFLGLGMGVVARVGLLAWGAGMLAASGVVKSILVIDSPRSTRAFVLAARPWLLQSAVSGAALAGVLGMGEIALSSRIQPPGIPLVGSALLNAMHYQYVDTVLPAVLGLVGLAIIAAIVPAQAIRRLSFSLVLGCCVVLPLRGCAPPPNALEPAPVDATVSFGGPGTVPGRFDYPRAIALDPSGGGLVVIDKSARVQRFDLEGTYVTGWRMPQWENGKPTGVAIADDGRIFVADTHYHRVAIFDLQGSELLAFGSYGEEAGEFIYPTDIAFGPDGLLFVAEYGGNDRIQVFDSSGTFLREFGSIGEGVGQFSRPQALAWREATGELFIADAINHRIVVTDHKGNWKRVLGGPGREPGKLAYPYDLALLEDGSIAVVEFGNNRIQHLDAISGECLGLWGGTGREEGRLRYPWGIDAGNGVLTVLDSGNSRVLIGDAP